MFEEIDNYGHPENPTPDQWRRRNLALSELIGQAEYQEREALTARDAAYARVTELNVENDALKAQIAALKKKSRAAAKAASNGKPRKAREPKAEVVVEGPKTVKRSTGQSRRLKQAVAARKPKAEAQ